MKALANEKAYANIIEKNTEIKFGKYLGKTFLKIYEKDQDY